MLLILAAALLFAGPVSADEMKGKCLLEVAGTTYIDGPCEIRMDTGTTVVSEMGVAQGNGYFAYLFPDGDFADASWNGTPSATHAHNALGYLKRDGACWESSLAKICAWR